VREGYCVLINLEGRKCVVIGGGSVAQRKVEALCRCGAQVLIVAPQVTDALAKRTDVTILEQAYDKEVLSGATLAFACTDDKDLNHQVARDCRKLGVLCNAVDDPQWCDFIVPAVLRRGPIQVAVATCGASPYLAGRIRDLIGGWLDRAYEPFAKLLASIRPKVLDEISQIDRRKEIFQRLAGRESFEHFKREGEAGWRKWADLTTEGQIKLSSAQEGKPQRTEKPAEESQS